MQSLPQGLRSTRAPPIRPRPSNYDNNKDMKQAASWIDQALEKNPDAYFMHYKKAQIQAKLGNKKEAIASAQKTIDILKNGKAPDKSAIRNAQQIIDSSK